MMKLSKQRHKQTGSMLIEALVSVLIFSIGILALMGLQMASINETTQSKFRADAAFLANSLIGHMRVVRVADVKNTFETGKYGYQIWKQQVEQLLPQSNGCNTTVSVSTSNVAVVTLQWKSPQAADTEPCHEFVVVTQIADN